MTTHNKPTLEFSKLLEEIPNIAKQHHANTIIERAKSNASKAIVSIKQLPPLSKEKQKSAIIISAGPSVHRKQSLQKIKESHYSGTIIAVDGAYLACLKAEVFPDYVVTLDPHPTRVVRWFGDPNIEVHSTNDDYFIRQDLDIEFRKNSLAQNQKHIELVNTFASKTKALVSTTSHGDTVVARLIDAKFDMYWWNPLVDNPNDPESLTRQLYTINKLPCINTGGTVGTAAWVIASTHFKIPAIAVVGMDYGYYHDTPYNQTQGYYELLAHLGENTLPDKYFHETEFPLTGEKFYTDTTYFWYKQNFLELIKKSNTVTFNCSEGGTLCEEKIECIFLEQFLKMYQ